MDDDPLLVATPKDDRDTTTVGHFLTFGISGLEMKVGSDVGHVATRLDVDIGVVGFHRPRQCVREHILIERFDRLPATKLPPLEEQQHVRIVSVKLSDEIKISFFPRIIEFEQALTNLLRRCRIVFVRCGFSG